MRNFKIIQGGMGVGVSSWNLARAVAAEGELGVVSGTGLNTSFVRRLQDGDREGDYRRAMSAFPVPEVSQDALDRYYIEGGKRDDEPYRRTPMATLEGIKSLQQLTALATFVEVYLAREGHEGAVGINFLEKIHLSNLAGIYGAMLAGVDVVLMGAGIPREIPGVLDRFSQQESATIRVPVHGAPADREFTTTFDPGGIFPELRALYLNRPRFFAIISSATLATHLAKRSNGVVDGFVVEGPTAGGHNAPPRGTVVLNDRGEPVYGLKDLPDLEKIRALGRPFWLAGSYGTPQGLAEALRLGAAGIQVGTAFAFSDESGFTAQLKRRIIQKWRSGKPGDGDLQVLTDPLVSPTGFPFKVVSLAGSLSEPEIRAQRPRKCDLGYLREAYLRADGTVGYRCPGEPVDDYVKKGGDEKDTVGKACLCNALLSNLGLGQRQESGYAEPPLVTAGDRMEVVRDLARTDSDSYTARDVLRYLRGTS